GARGAGRWTPARLEPPRGGNRGRALRARARRVPLGGSVRPAGARGRPHPTVALSNTPKWGFQRTRFPLTCARIPQRARGGTRAVQRLFTTFPSGAPGLGLLLLRLAVAVRLLDHSAACFADATASTGAWLVGALAAVTGAVLILGLVTPLSGALAAA